jgi:hypothetical protein
MNKFELIALIEAHAKLATAAGVENNFKGNQAKRAKHIKAIEELEEKLKGL